MEKIVPHKTLDVKGLKCPVPVLKTKIAFKDMKPGEILEVVATDPGSKKDLPAWAQKTGNILLATVEEEGQYRFFLQRPAEGEKAPPKVHEAPEAQPRKRRMLLICSKGTLDMAYPPFILATTAASMDVDVKMFFTFYGLDIINRHKVRKLKVAPLANPAMPMPVPNIIGALPGMSAMATMMMKGMMKKGNVPDIMEFIKTAKEMGVVLLGCQMTMDVMGVKREDLIDEVSDTVGAAAFVSDAMDADVTLFI
jgi:peroxiredoxin family protein/TusA-related sulfurtransferase